MGYVPAQKGGGAFAPNIMRATIEAPVSMVADSGLVKVPFTLATYGDAGLLIDGIVTVPPGYWMRLLVQVSMTRNTTSTARAAQIDTNLPFERFSFNYRTSTSGYQSNLMQVDTGIIPPQNEIATFEVFAQSASAIQSVIISQTHLILEYWK